MTQWLRSPAALIVAVSVFLAADSVGAGNAAKPADSKPSAAGSPAAKHAAKQAKPAIVPQPRAAGSAAREAVEPAPKPPTPNPGSIDGLPGDPSNLHDVDSFDSGRIGFSLRYAGVESPFETMSAFVLPGETLQIEAVGGSGYFAASSRTGRLVADPRKPIWRWKAPNVHGGDHQIRIRDRSAGKTDVAVLHVFVMRPYDGGTTIGDYPLGSYQPAAITFENALPRTKDTEEPPAGFIEVTDRNRETQVSPHFKLSQFICKDRFDGTKYMALRPTLLLALERVLEGLARRGMPAKTLQVMSGFRTPAYNAGLGNETSRSRHLYGDAADVFLDRDDDGEMDDLDGDGMVTRQDAVVLHDLAEQVLGGHEKAGTYVGGLSAYEPSRSHGPFVHIDTRGARVRW